MMRVVAYYFSDDDKLGPEIADIRSGTGHQDLASDLVRLADLADIYEAQSDVVKHDTKHYRATDARDARTNAHTILEALSATQNAEYKKWLDLSARAWTLLAAHYAETGAASPAAAAPAK